MKPLAEMTAGEVAAYVSSHLRAGGVEAVLSGGACVTIYGDGRYVTGDIDLVIQGIGRRRRVAQLLAELGFRPQGRFFMHPECRWTVDTHPEPVCVGAEPVTRIDRLEFSTGVLRVISPTDCVKDRLAAYVHWNDLQALEQAVSVAAANDVDMDDIRRWSENEGAADKFEAFRQALTRPQTRPPGRTAE